MEEKSTIPFWSVDAFLCFVMQRGETAWSSELLSRTSTFIDAYILFDKVVLLERYKKDEDIKKLDPNNEIFEYIKSSSLLHSDHICKGITIYLSLNYKNLEELEANNYKWWCQHTPLLADLPEKDFKKMMQKEDISFAHLILWQISLLSEISDLTKSTSIVPLSLQRFDYVKHRKLPFHVSKLEELDNHFQERIRTVSAITGEEYSDYIENVPPFLTLLIDRSLSKEHAVEVLCQLRKDFKSLRQTSTECSRIVKKETGLREKTEIINEWNYAWELLLKGDFIKPQLLKRKVSSSDISKAIIKPNSAGLSSVIQSFLDYREEVKSYHRFRIYGELYNELNVIERAAEKLKKKFSLNLVNFL